MTTPARRLPRALLPFRHRAYRRLAVSLFFSLFTSGLWAVAQVWEVIRIGGGPPELSAVGAAASAGTLVFGLVGGVLADRLPQKHILLGVHGVQAACFGAAAVLSLTGQTRLWHLVVIGFVGGMASAFYYPAYSAWIPALVAADDLMAVNGFEGALRPTVQQAAGPAVAGLIIGALSPGIALAAASCCALLATGILTTVPATPLRGTRGTAPRSAVGDLLEGFRYVVSTRWLLSSLLFAALLVLAVMGPLQVLLPFFIKDHLGGDASAHAGMMAAFGVGGAAGSAVMTSLRIPRRYLTATLGMWGLSCTSFALIAVSDRLLTVAIAAFVLGALFSAPMVIWGTLLQRLVPPHLLGRVSSLDFFVSIALMPLSLAVAGPVAALIGLTPTFLIAAVIPLLAALVTIVLARLPKEELAHPLTDPRPEPAAA